MNEKKIEVKICVGTACFVQGGADLLLYKEFLDSSILERCHFEGTSCLESCKNEKPNVRSPFVEIDGTIYGNVNPQLLKELLEEALDAGN
ncbi:MAG: (2Fe-2S) ferredoxin domain-containing protein [Sphaerochaetaceae bacterium]|jgi:NADH:ubiquinone oxidoreductase subunit E